MIAKRNTPAQAEDSLAITQIAVEKLDPHPDNPRVTFDEAELQALGASLANLEQLQPVHVQPMPGGRFRLLTGERRWRAAKLTGQKTIAAFVRHVDDQKAAQIVAEDNLQFVALNPIERARAFALLTRSKDKGGAGLTQAIIAKRMKQDPSNVANTMRLLKLPAEWQQRVAAGELGYRAARALAGYADKPQVLAKMEAELKRDPALNTAGFETRLVTIAGCDKHNPADVSPDTAADEAADVSPDTIDDAEPVAILPLSRRAAPVDHSPPAKSIVSTMMQWISEIESLEDLAKLSEAIEARAATLQPKKRKAK